MGKRLAFAATRRQAENPANGGARSSREPCRGARKSHARVPRAQRGHCRPRRRVRGCRACRSPREAGGAGDTGARSSGKEPCGGAAGGSPCTANQPRGGAGGCPPPRGPAPRGSQALSCLTERFLACAQPRGSGARLRSWWRWTRTEARRRPQAARGRTGGWRASGSKAGSASVRAPAPPRNLRRWKLPQRT